MLFLQESISPMMANISEMKRGNDLFLTGLLMAGEVRNGNKRWYPKEEITKACDNASKRLSEGFSIMGELNHPDTISINLDRVSHIITEVKVNGNNGYGKMKVLNTPCGLTARALLEGGARIGVSTRGTGNLNSSGVVSDYIMETVDLVATPSAPGAYPEMMYESLQHGKIQTLAEAAVHDVRAQEYLFREIKAFLAQVVGK